MYASSSGKPNDGVRRSTEYANVHASAMQTTEIAIAGAYGLMRVATRATRDIRHDVHQVTASFPGQGLQSRRLRYLLGRIVPSGVAVSTLTGPRLPGTPPWIASMSSGDVESASPRTTCGRLSLSTNVSG